MTCAADAVDAELMNALAAAVLNGLPAADCLLSLMYSMELTYAVASFDD